MILSDNAMLENGGLKISPYEKSQIQPASFDVRLAGSRVFMDNDS